MDNTKVGKKTSTTTIIMAVIGGLFGICFFCISSIAVLGLLADSGKSNRAAAADIEEKMTATELPTETFTPTFTALPTNTNFPPTLTPTFIATFTPTFTLVPPTLTPLPTATAIFAAGASCIPTNPPEVAKVVSVVDGDTIKVQIDNVIYSVRYIGMDTPEYTTTVEYFGAEATEYNRSLVAGKEVFLFKDVSETDRYGRLLRYVIADGIFVNFSLVRNGYATVATYPPDVACESVFRSAETTARSSIIGLWGKPTRMPTATEVIVIPVPIVPTSSGGSGGGGGGGGAVSGNCSPAYPTVCIPPPPPDLDCKDVLPLKKFKVLPPDPHHFDGDKDGIGCE